MLASVRGHGYLVRALERKHIRNARRIQRAIVRLQGLFIKVGQLFSILTNFLPPEFRHELEGLQDAVPARPYESIKARFIEDFGKEPLELYKEFDETPIAAASISQVHVARLADGQKVAVKVQYPDIDRMVTSDLKTFRRILKIISWFFPTQGLDVVYREVSQMLVAELDFCEEAKSIDRIAQNFRDGGIDDVGFPAVVRDLSTRHILTTGFVEGVKVSDTAGLEAGGHDRRAIARRLVDLYCRQIFVDGLYHADPHPGNILVAGSGRITLLDFGAVATIRPEMRKGIADFLQAVLNQNTEKIAQALRDMGFIAKPQNDEVFDRVVAYFHEKFQQSVRIESFNLSEIKVDPERGLEHLLALRQMDIGIGELSSAFQVPREWILLERTLLLLTGLCTHLDPEIRPMELIHPYLRRFLLGDEGDWSNFMLDTGKDLAIQFLALPSELKKFLVRASTGRLELRIQGQAAQTRLFYALGHQIIYTMSGIAAVSLATVLHLHGELALRDRALWFAYGSGALLLGSMWRAGRRNGRR